MEEGELKEALGEYYSVYVEFVSEKTTNEKAQVEHLKSKSRTLKRLNDRLKKQINETRNRAAKVTMISLDLTNKIVTRLQGVPPTKSAHKAESS